MGEKKIKFFLKNESNENWKGIFLKLLIYETIFFINYTS